MCADVHHGNGTQQTFEEDDRVLFISIHQDSNYPIGSGEHLEFVPKMLHLNCWLVPPFKPSKRRLHSQRLAYNRLLATTSCSYYKALLTHEVCCDTSGQLSTASPLQSLLKRLKLEYS